MKLIHKVEDCVVYKGNDSTYLLKIPSSPELLRTIKDAGTIKHVKKSTNATIDTIKFKATRVEPLKQFIEKMHDNNHVNDKNMNGMTYTLVLKLLADIGTLLQYAMNEYGRAIPFFNLEDIIVIENENENANEGAAISASASASASTFDFVFINGEKLLQISGDNDRNGEMNALRVDVPLMRNKQTSFLPLELAESELKHLPIIVTATSWLYSLSSLCIYALLNYKFKNGEDDIERIGRPFLHTSLYFCLKRCMKTKPEKRVLLYV
jgi:hypothetical protein